MLMNNPRIGTIFDFLELRPEETYEELTILYKRHECSDVLVVTEEGVEKTLLSIDPFDVASLATVFAQRFFDVVDEDIILDGSGIMELKMEFPSDVMTLKTADGKEHTEFFGDIHSIILRGQLHLVAD